MARPRAWNEDEVRELLELRRRGLRPKEIAGVMSFSRRAIIGKLHRLGEESWYVQEAAFWVGLGQLVKFAEEYGHCDAPHRYRGMGGSGVLLGKWVDFRRARRRVLPAYQVAALESVPGWSWEDGRHGRRRC